ncbi:hypothetical protein [Streptococcus ruminantium]|uniref:hypothetical protein n=1 Tax=Streptococcus ruminantium TaxID=1917441 RepID=UPI0012DECCDE|nr:hypothetical protein [Streptococcus ruminantium]
MSNKTLFDEINAIQEESHTKWCKRYFDKIDIEKCIKRRVAEGYKSAEISILSEKDPYIKRRLDNERTVEYLKHRLGKGFVVKNEKVHSKFKISEHPIIERHALIISW